MRQGKQPRSIDLRAVDPATVGCVEELRARGAWIDYEWFLPPTKHRQLREATMLLRHELPYAWADRYARLNPHATNVLEVDAEGFEYLFDEPSELVSRGEVAEADVVQDRLVAAHGFSHAEKEDRDRSQSRLAGAPRGPAEVVDTGAAPYDRGHVMAHSIGGGLDLNLVPQLASVNRRGLWRRMERYCSQHPGTYVFCAPIYLGLSGHPAYIDYGVLLADCSLWVNVFRNHRSVAELNEIERLYRARQANVR